MKLKFVIPVIVYTLFSLTSLWGSDCVLQSEGPIKDAISLQQSGHINCDYVLQVENLLIGIQNFSEEKVAINLLVRASYDNASFDGGFNLDVPERLVFYSTYGQEYGTSITSNLAVVAHEYGHALLEKTLEKTFLKEFPKMAGFIKVRQELSNIEIQSIKNPDSEELKNLFKEKTKESMNNKDFIRFLIMTAPYSELFADVVSVYEGSDKNAIFYALDYDQIDRMSYRFIQTRSFEMELTEKHEPFMTEAHGMFALTRNYIGVNLWPKNEAEKKIMLKKISDAIVVELRELFSTVTELPDYKILNAKLIKRLSAK